MNRKIGGTIVILIGVAFVVGTLVSGIPTVAGAFEKMTDGFRPVMKAEHLGTLSADVQALGGAAQEFQTKVLPLVAQQMKTTPENASAILADAYPAVMKGVSQAPAITSSFDGVMDLLAAERERFEKADAIPASNIPASTMPQLLTVAGLAVIAVGVSMLRLGKKGIALSIVLGLILAIVPFALSLPGKASAADTMNDHLKPVYTGEFVAQAEGSFQTIGAMASEMSTKLLPAFASQAGVTVQQYQQQLAQVSPALAAAIQGMPAALDRFGDLLAVFSEQLPNYNEVKGFAMSPVVMSLIVGGILVVLATGAAMFERKAEKDTFAPLIARKAA
jgi:hypothetical protein